MKRFIYLFLLFIVVLGGSVIAHFPASFLYTHAPQNKALDISGISGTVWHGFANDVRWQGISLGQFRWDFSASRLLQGKAEYVFRFGKGSDLDLAGTGVAGYSLQGPYLSNVVASVPVVTVTERIQIPVPVEAKGTLELTLSNYTYAQPWCKHADGSFVWNGSEIDSPLGALMLGSIFTDFTCHDSRLEIFGEHDAPQASGSITSELTPNMQYRLSAWLKPGAELPDSFRAQLGWLGNPNNDGRYVFELSGKL